MYRIQVPEGTDYPVMEHAGISRPLEQQGLVARAERDLQIFSSSGALSFTSNTKVFIPLHVRVQVPVGVYHPVIQQAGVDAVAHPHKQGLVVRAERDPRDLAEEVDLLPLPVALSSAVDVHKVRGLREEQEPPVRGVADASDRADVAPQDREGGRRIPDVPHPAGLVLVPGCKGDTVWVPR